MIIIFFMRYMCVYARMYSSHLASHTMCICLSVLYIVCVRGSLSISYRLNKYLAATAATEAEV